MSLHALRPRRALLAAPLCAALLLTAACGTADEEPDSGSAGSADFTPVTFEHAFGETPVEEKPERVATWGWASTDAVLALGVAPVAIPENSYGADAEGYMPWQKEALDEMGAEEPALLTEGEAPPFEEIAAADPDLILAHYSGITKADYDRLSSIAPTVAYPDEPWATPWRDVITTTGEALGMAEEAEQVLEDIDAEVAEAAEAHPEFEGRSIAAVAFPASTYYVYTPADPRVQFLEDLGFTVADSVADLDTGEASFFYTLSAEKLDQLTSDVLLSYADDDAARDAVEDDPAVAAMQQFQDGRVAHVVGQDVVSSVSPPTALSLTWGLDTFVDALSEAVAQAG